MADRPGPDAEHTRLSIREQAAWLRVVAYEARHDRTGKLASDTLAKTLLLSQPWCDCQAHNAALDAVLGVLWREPLIG